MPPPPPLYLKNPGTGDTTAELYKVLSTDGADNSSQPNYDTDRNGHPGLALAPTGSGFGEWDPVKHARWGIDVSNQDVTGVPVLTLYVATDSDLGGSTTPIRADVADCSSNLLWCSSLASSVTADVGTHVGSGFQQVTLTFASISHSFGWSRRLAVRLINEDGQTLHIAFDSDPYPSALAGLEIN